MLGVDREFCPGVKKRIDVYVFTERRMVQMGMNQAQRTGALSRSDVLWYYAEQLTLVTDPKHVLYDKERTEREPSEAMIQNMMVEGVLEPLKVRSNIVAGKEYIEIADGRGRYKAAVVADSRIVAAGGDRLRIPVMFKKMSDAQAFRLMVSTFIRDEDSPLSRMSKVVRGKEMGFSGQELATMFGVSVGTINGYEALDDCAPDVQAAVGAGDLGVVFAAKLAKLPIEEQTAALAEMRAEGAMKGARGLAKIEEKTGKPPGPRVRSRKHIESMIDILKEAPTDERPDAARVLRYVLGDDGALGARWKPETKTKAIAEESEEVEA